MDGKIFTINSVLSGTFYRRPSPDEPPYVEEGDKVKPGQVVCIVESMKIFNEVRVERKGVIRKILIEDEDPVLIHQPMFEVEVI
jgi:acetyl-CoA carboxylase biotin carboxyl carrier protein